MINIKINFIFEYYYICDWVKEDGNKGQGGHTSNTSAH